MGDVTPYRPLAGLARAVVIALVVGAVVDAIVAVYSVVDAQLMQRAFDDVDSVSSSRLALSDTLGVVSSLAVWATYIPTVVLFLVWFHRANANLPALGQLPRYSPGWAVGSWFVPIVNLFIPKRATNDTYRAGDGPDAPYPAVFNAWWALWLVSSFAYNLAFRAWADADEFDEFRDADYADAVSSGLAVLAAILAIQVVRAVTRRQEERFAEGPRTPPPDDGPGFTSTPGWAPAPEYADDLDPTPRRDPNDDGALVAPERPR